MEPGREPRLLGSSSITDGALALTLLVCDSTCFFNCEVATITLATKGQLESHMWACQARAGVPWPFCRTGPKWQQGPLLTAPVLCCRASRAPARPSVAWGSSYFTLKHRGHRSRQMTPLPYQACQSRENRGWRLQPHAQLRRKGCFSDGPREAGGQGWTWGHSGRNWSGFPER